MSLTAYCLCTQLHNSVAHCICYMNSLSEKILVVDMLKQQLLCCNSNLSFHIVLCFEAKRYLLFGERKSHGSLVFTQEPCACFVHFMVLFTVLKISDTNIHWRCIRFANLTSSQGLFSVHNEKALINTKKIFFIGFYLFIKIKLFAVFLKRQTI